MRNFLAIDAGGTSTRAVLINSSGQCLGYGTAGGGNPVSRGFDAALAALLDASRKATGGTAGEVAEVLVAMAGASLELPTHLFRDGFAELGLTGKVMIESDLLATFYSGTYHDDGLALIAGTGAVGARVVSSRLEAVTDGTGWLLGDNGAGFWLGREIVRAVAAALDGRGQATSLTLLVLAELGVTLDPGERTQGRLRAQQQLILKVYELPAIELSRFAPLVFQVKDDAVAQDIIDRAAQALTQTLLAASRAGNGPGEADGRQWQPGAQPLVFGGSVLTKGGAVAAAVVGRLSAAMPGAGGPAGISPVLVEDGVVGASVMVLKRSGIQVDAPIFARIQQSLAALRGGK
ncbi:hypothetical protein ART_2817 [Arthrobacter sp. PAMC 25486]|uniref:N-acetylglucosamine kinase n=1 Tax=Arthrobacter sp. PAMC 25486 TaxID=1494608 RepID=UPI000535ECDB|nr:BadF/BadG/BcrA/BcrD ATPase family protein [Arthrobacter sp. PAMC 25486]AIY02416.1 hypothetical protein ART_2817 [Arthrobacter sp. PAMC 25486]